MRLLLLFILFPFLFAGCDSNQQPLSQDMYVWQRAWQPSVLSAIDTISPHVGRFALLAAEIEFPAGGPRALFSQLDYAGLQRTTRPIVLCLRIGAWKESFDRQHPTTLYILQTIEKVLAHARRAGMQAAEFQIDFDCSEADLSGYRTWLRQIRSVTDDLRLSFTALPSWLKQPDFAGLVEEADSFVLQVHSLQKNEGHESGYSLCEASAALAWVDEANRFQKDFSVALPTYGYQVVTDSLGRTIDIIAEEPKSKMVVPGKPNLVLSDPKDMVLLVSHWEKNRPEYLRSIIWYRLPVATDQLNWPISALLAVMAGRVPVTNLQIKLQTPEPGLTEIWIENIGETTLYQARIEAESDLSKLLAAEATNGFSLKQTDHGIVFETTPAREGGLRPGEMIIIGWMRFHENQNVSITVL